MNRYLLFFCFTMCSLLSMMGRTLDKKTPVGRVQLELDEQLGALRYEIELQDQKKKTQPIVFKSETPGFDVQVNAGKYLFRARVLDARGVPGPWSESQLVLVTPAVSQTLEEPELVDFVESNPKALVWSKKADYLVEGVLEYQAYFSKEWVPVKKIEKYEGNSWKLDGDLKRGRYRWTMKFVDEVYGESKTIEKMFVLKPTQKEIESAVLTIDKVL